MASTAAEFVPEEVPLPPRRGRLRRIARGLRRQPVALVAGVILLVVFLVGLIAPTFDPGAGQLHLDNVDKAPTFSGWHLFGTSDLGRDVLRYSLLGLHTTEQIAVLGTLIATALGVVIGAVAGFRGGWLDIVLMRIADVIGIPPAIFILLVCYFYYRPVTPWKASLIFAVLLWIPVARVVRAEVVSLRSREFIEAAISVGASSWRIFFRHLLPNLASVIVIAFSTTFGLLIMLEATVEFFQLGESETSQPTLGFLIGQGKQFEIVLNAGWWTWAGPAFILVLILVCANLLGDGVAEALRPNSRR
jgi:peptide/nickel transport system permease protein